jgi:protein-S-isoprenylcysteine O-methyltransferase Ste14
MDKILKFLQDPSWWFSAFFVAIIASILAAFAKDWIGNLISHFSGSYRKWNQKRVAAQNERVNRLASNFDCLVISYLKSIVGLMLFMQSFSLFLLIPMWGNLMIRDPSFNSMMLFSSEYQLLFVKLMAVLLGLASIISGYLSALMFRFSNEAFREYRKNKRTSHTVQ